MVMTVECPSCASSFPVDPAKIPEGGVNARCTVCAEVFRVERPADDEPVAPSGPDVPSPDAEVRGETFAEPEGEAFAEPEEETFAEPEEETFAEPEGETFAEPEEETKASEDPAPDGDWQAWDAGGSAAQEETDVGFEAEEETGEADDWVFETDDDMTGSSPAMEIDAEADELAEPDDFFGGGGPTLESEAPTDEAAEDETPSEEETPSFDMGDDEMALETEPGAEAPPDEAPAAAAPDKPVQGFSFGERDPSDKARRLARVLVSDMIMYNPERHQRALENGTLKDDFEDEIAKSWKEYVDQVGEEMAEDTTFWTEALNDILAKGDDVF